MFKIVSFRYESVIQKDFFAQPPPPPNHKSVPTALKQNDYFISILIPVTVQYTQYDNIYSYTSKNSNGKYVQNIKMCIFIVLSVGFVFTIKALQLVTRYMKRGLHTLCVLPF